MSFSSMLSLVFGMSTPIGGFDKYDVITFIEDMRGLSSAWYYNSVDGGSHTLNGAEYALQCLGQSGAYGHIV